MKWNWFFIFIGGGFGSLSRYYLSALLNTKNALMIPWGTFLSNLVACIILGYAVGKAGKAEGESELWVYLISIGFCGAFSTFSTFTKENYELYIQGAYGSLCLYIVISLILGFLGFILGHSLA